MCLGRKFPVSSFEGNGSHNDYVNVNMSHSWHQTNFCSKLGSLKNAADPSPVLSCQLHGDTLFKYPAQRRRNPDAGFISNPDLTDKSAQYQT